MESAKTGKGSFERFMGTFWFRIIYLMLIAVLASLMLVYVGGIVCLTLVLIGIAMFGIPYWLKERDMKRFMVNGLVIFVPFLLISAYVLASVYLSTGPVDLSAQSGSSSLSQGRVVPYDYKGNPSTLFQFSVKYTNTVPLLPANVTVTLHIFDFGSQSDHTYLMAGNTTGSVTTQGWSYTDSRTVPEGVYFFWFNATTKPSDNITTPAGFGPIDAPWSAYYWFTFQIVVFYVILAVMFYYIIVGLYWWLGRARQMRARVPPVVKPPVQKPAEGGGKGAFECTNCGADVDEDATRCPRCGALFEEEEKPVVRAKKVEKEKDASLREKDPFQKK